ncbi:DUF2235 domain-containing protein [Roseovarius sp. LXJ103]|uniref:T6SS phospholipase effector Tle1-like catalytic domain-containing protein n=1 Tax=Roseovarius carneus TaxID=2853164 RepID=UPI000D61CC80|nr:DUF2235 domain-containing protein [Roseovarius carneus]PWE34615.1 hypothetical protein DD563_00560 [Pelagicola sp. LXJ1103]
MKQAYQFLCLACRPGDPIYLFGFSRGAFTARSVAGMIRKRALIEGPIEARPEYRPGSLFTGAPAPRPGPQQPDR